jgi:acyl carrier protein
MFDESEIRTQVRAIIVRIAPGIDAGIDDDADIFAMGLDSVSVMVLLDELEEHYSISLASDELPYDRFRTITGIATFLAEKLASKNS